MSFLQESEISQYAPNSGASMVNILIAQAAIEAWLGYSLESQERQEILKLTKKSKTAQLSYIPVASTPTPIFEIREGNTRDRFDRDISLTEWDTLQSDDYVLDSTGLISLNTINTALAFGHSCGQPSYLRATYTSGLEFTQDTDEINALKAATGQVISYQMTPSFTGGVREIQVNEQYRKRYSDGGSSSLPPGQTPEALFRAFQKYKPRSAILVG